MKFLIDDAVYSYEIYGREQATTIVMLHGFTGSSETWKEFVACWQDIYRIITVDLPGHGKSHSATPRSMEACCADLDALFQHVGLDAFHLVGYSMGGRTALSYAVSYPTMLKSLILESASPGLKSEQERAARMASDEKLAEKILKEGITSFVDYWENIPLFATQKHLPEEKKEFIRRERLSQRAEGLHDSLIFMGTGKQPSLWHLLPELKLPILLLAGEHDQKFIAISQHMEKLFSEADLHIVLKAGHAIHVEESEVFGKIVNGFILSVSS
ncbi:2-succinyl-6-hydroxy-2,4-cyclohexadiene-1-carboxylate synthase [Virgibacillus halophilus]|uniref:Putative 2-succinyl-6-hydroxy-2,4-cyclohexadiene-1-carboxylate synthase n=1 Tax=Tigheibacillus halophilus TaxID=361280 RepID=A0ABU5C1H0_9BACI|nr:2-succinyl-6-hydroxy-2,4-cyclohexadiene-1-carboxylate synthase [Virgibacillus halophilus]